MHLKGYGESILANGRMLFHWLLILSMDVCVPLKDVDEVTVHYPSIFELMYDLKGMGESSADWRRKLYLRRDTLAAAAAIYSGTYAHADYSIYGIVFLSYM